jgi:hypothetical protein
MARVNVAAEVIPMLQLTRVRQWQSQLDALLSERASSPFVWGQNDCCIFAADVVAALTGTDPAADLRGTYSTQEEAHALLAERGGIGGIVTQMLGDPVPRLMARVGDLGLVTHDGTETLAVCIGQQWRAVSMTGLVLVFARHIGPCWRVG